MKNLLLSLITFCICLIGYAQVPDQRCHTDEYIEHLEDKYPGTIANMEAARQVVKEYQQNQQNAAFSQSNPILTIPVVVHVLWNNAQENISDAQILSQIEVLNEDFRLNNADASIVDAQFQGIMADSQIEFCLASIDPNGDPTDGITRTQTSTTSFGFYNSPTDPGAGGVAGWPNDEYMNIWVCNLGYGLLGYATPPGGPPNEDGLVCLYSAFGNTGTVFPPYDLGRTATHEIGHYLSLAHPWGNAGGCGDDDGIADTPTSESPYFGCPTIGPGSTSCGSQDCFYVFMDYCDDACLVMFSEGQKADMVAVMNTVRASLVSSSAIVCNADSTGGGPGPDPIEPVTVDAGLDFVSPSTLICDNDLTPVISIVNSGDTLITYMEIVYNVNGSVDQTQVWNGSLEPGQTAEITLFTSPISSDITLNVSIENINNGDDDNMTNNDISIDFTVPVYGQFPLEEAFEMQYFEQNGWSNENVDNDNVEWEKNSNIGAQGSSSSFWINNQLSSTGDVDHLVMPYMDLDGKTNITLKFDYAYATTLSGSVDGMTVSYSIDCGSTWNDLWNEQGSTLATGESTDDLFEPLFNEWQEQYLDLDFLNDQSKVLFRFTAVSGGGNALYLDNINIDFQDEIPASVEEYLLDNDFVVYPNPSTDGIVNIMTANHLNGNTILNVYDISGQNYIQMSIDRFESINLGHLESGCYFIHLTNGDHTEVEKIVISR